MEDDKSFKEDGPPDSLDSPPTPPQSDNEEIEPKLDNGSFKFRHDDDNDNAEPKIVARLTPDDDFAPYVVTSPHHRRAVSVDHIVAKIPENYNSSPSANARSNLVNASGLTRGQIDTAAPIASVKAAVSKFGGIVDWKAHRVQTVERRKFIEIELERAQEEMPTYRQQCEAAEEAKAQVVKELDGTKRLIEELKLNLERAQKEEQQAKQDTDLAKLRVEEMEQGIAEESSFAAKAQLEVARARHAAAVNELHAVNEELEQLRKDYDLLVKEKDSAERKAEEAVETSKEVEKSVQDLTIEIIGLKQSLESAHSEHLEAEEHRLGAVMAKEEDAVNWEEELKQAEEEIEKLNQKMLSTKELKMKLNEATALLQELKSELAAYMETKDEVCVEGNYLEADNKTRGGIKAAVNAAGKELEEVKLRITKANEEANSAKTESEALKSQIEQEKIELTNIQQRESKVSIAVSALEEELKATESEIEIVRAKEKEESEKMADFPKKLEEASQEAEQAKSLAIKAREELLKAKEEAERAKARKANKESELRAAQKEIEAAKAAEKLALAAITALEESESAQKNDGEDSPITGVTLSVEEYYEISKRAHDAEEEANARVAAAISEIEVAKESEVKILSKLEEVSRETSKRKEELEMAQQKAEQAEERKLAVEQELRKWRAEHEQRRKAADQSGTDGKDSKLSVSVPESSSTMHQRSSPKGHEANGEKDTEVSTDSKSTKKKKKSFFPKFFMFLGRKKSQSSKKD